MMIFCIRPWSVSGGRLRMPRKYWSYSTRRRFSPWSSSSSSSSTGSCWPRAIRAEFGLGGGQLESELPGRCQKRRAVEGRGKELLAVEELAEERHRQPLEQQVEIPALCRSE